MPTTNGQRTTAGLDRLELVLFVGGVLLVAAFMAIFLQPLSDPLGLLVLVAWLVGGLAYVAWFDRDLAKRPPARRGPRR
jgi:hypothetical protein